MRKMNSCCFGALDDADLSGLNECPEAVNIDNNVSARPKHLRDGALSDAHLLSDFDLAVFGDELFQGYRFHCIASKCPLRVALLIFTNKALIFAVLGLGMANIEFRSMSTKRRELTAEERAAAVRLGEIYARKKAEAKAAGDKLTQDMVAEACGWSSQSALSQYINGRIPLNLDAVLELAKALKVRPEEISPEISRKAASSLFTPNATTHVTKSDRIPLISWVQAGSWHETIDLYEVGDAEEWILCPVNHSDSTFALRVRGESMFNPGGEGPSFSDGDIIYVDPSRQPENRSLVVVRQNDCEETTFKQLILEGGDKMLKALNPSWPNRILPMMDDCQICGVVIGRYTPF